MDLNRIYEGDCLDLFSQVPVDSSQLTFANLRRSTLQSGKLQAPSSETPKAFVAL
jgi:hypothetical protein